MPKIETKEWRCPKCDRLLAVEKTDKKVEVISSSRQVILAEYKRVEAKCKCGYRAIKVISS